MLEAQVRANQKNSSVRVNFQTYSTLVEPNLPHFTNEELTSRLSLALKEVFAHKMSKPMLFPSIDDDEEDDEIDILSQSILSKKIVIFPFLLFFHYFLVII